MEEKGWSDDEAQNKVYNSIIFSKLEDESTGLYLYQWQEIYKILKQELEN